MPVPPIAALPPAPSTADPTNFATKADALLAALESPFVSEMNASIAAINSAATDADTDATAAAASAATASAAALTAVNAPGTKGTSATSLTIGTGDQTFTTQTGKSWGLGQLVRMSSSADVSKWMVGQIEAYDSGTGAMTVGVTKINGSGSASDWSIALAAESNIVGRHAIWVPAVAMTPRTTNGAAAGSVETSTNKVMIKTLDFDASTIEYAQVAIRMPKSWNLGTVTFVPEWSHPSTTTNYKVSWGLQAVAISDGDALDAAFGTAQYSNDTGGATNTKYAGPESAAITVAGTPAAEDLVIFQLLRKADDGTNDTLAVDARLHGITLYITTNAENDA